MRKLCWFALPFCAAILLACLGLPAPALVGAICAVLGLLAGCLKRLPVCLLCLGVAVGLLWSYGYACLFRAPAEALAGQSIPLQATVLTFPQETSNGSFSMEIQLHSHGISKPKVLLYADSSGANLRPGDAIACTARIQRADHIRGERISYYEADGIYLRANALTPLTVQQPAHRSMRFWPVYLAQAFQQSAQILFPEDISGFMTALLTGDKSELSHSDYTALQRAGAAHIVAVSGLHLSFLAGLLTLLFRRHSKWGAGLTIVLIFFYAAVAGFTPSVTRAAFMIALSLLAPLFGRETDTPTTLSFILLLLLLQNPYAVLSVSLQLSFAAVAGISLAAGTLYRGMTGFLSEHSAKWRTLLRGVYRFFAANFSVTLGAMLFTVPLTALHFGSVALISPLTNLISLWAVSDAFFVALPLTALGAVVPGLPSVLALPATLLGRFVLWCAHTLSRLPFANLSMDSLYLRAWLVLVYLLLLLLFLRRYRRPLLPLCTGIITLCAALMFTRAATLSCPLSVTMLDVGQGQCILLCSGGRTALIDCGGNKGNAGDLAADHLQTLGISTLDLLVLTHCHDDHANGVPELLERMEVSALILPDLAREESAYRREILTLAEAQGTQVTLLSDHRALNFGESVLTLYAPLSDGGSNEEGLFVLASCGSFDLLVTGDANDFVESLLVKYGSLPDIEVLVAGHHGSKHSTSTQLLDAVTPETCLISSGYNAYGHPTEETLARLASRDIDIYRTDYMGHLTLRYEGESVCRPKKTMALP